MRYSGVYVNDKCSTGVDITDYEGLIGVDMTACTVTGTPTTATLTIETSDTLGSGYTAVGTAATVTAGAGARNRQILDTNALKRYLRVTLAFVGGTAPTLTGVVNITACKKQGY